MLTRRRCLTLIGASFALSNLCMGMEEQEWRRQLMEAINSHDSITLGHVLPPPDDGTWKKAHAILDAAPTGVAPLQVANYFTTSVPPEYQRAWPEPDIQHPTYANPLIVLFFLATAQRPAGDTTAWCSAFVNWCLSRCHIKGTNNAGSQSFVDQNWGSEIWNKSQKTLPTDAHEGDIAVFRHRSDPVHGHVAFFQGISHSRPRSIDVIGGNQIVGSGPGKVHLIDRRSMRIFSEDTDLELISIRTTKGLGNV
jgi:uncharacterized protein (TIGR02594 family)